MPIEIVIKANELKSSQFLSVSTTELDKFPALYCDRYTYIVKGSIVGRIQDPIYSRKGDPYYTNEHAAYGLYIGAFNSIANDVCFMIDNDHDYKSVSSQDEMCCELFEPHPYKIRRKGSIIVQNDVWIGHGCTIYGGVTIHNGAVIAGNSVVTKDVPPYTIVGGAPAKILKPRLDPDTAEKLQAIEWWNWSSEKIRANREWFKKDPKEFADYFYDKVTPPPSTINTAELPEFEKTYLFFPDFNEPYGVWKRVISGFFRSFSDDDSAGMIIFLEPRFDTPQFREKAEALINGADKKRRMFFCSGDDGDEAAVFSHADYYITSRSLRTVRRSCLADRYGVSVISGTDIPVFYSP